jgi:trypsin
MKFLALAALALPALAELPVPEGLVLGEVDAPAFESQIVGGTAATAGEFPYIVSLSRSGSHFCGGSLLNAYTVVTAAHCSVGQSASAVRVRAGSLQWASGGVQVGVSQILVHPSYSSSTLNNDVALWHLSSPINAGTNIGYVTLPAASSDPAAGSSSTVAGWGTTSSGSSSIPAALRRVDVPIVARATCNTNYSGDITANMICAAVSGGGKDSCQGDSGGPLVNAARQLIGIVSWGIGCAAAQYPGVYTRVGNYVAWINANRWTS